MSLTYVHTGPARQGSICCAEALAKIRRSRGPAAPATIVAPRRLRQQGAGQQTGCDNGCGPRWFDGWRFLLPLKGNHEAMMVEAAAGPPRKMDGWIDEGRRQPPIKSYGGRSVADTAKPMSPGLDGLPADAHRRAPGSFRSQPASIPTSRSTRQAEHTRCLWKRYPERIQERFWPPPCRATATTPLRTARSCMKGRTNLDNTLAWRTGRAGDRRVR